MEPASLPVNMFKERDVNALPWSLSATRATKPQDPTPWEGRVKRDCSAVLCPFCTTSQLQQGQQVTHPHKSKGVTGSTLMGREKMDQHSLGLRQAFRVPFMSHRCLTHGLSSVSGGCHMEGKVPQALGRAVKPHFLVPPVPAWAAIPKLDPPHRDHPCDVIPDRNPSGNAQSCKDSWGMSSHQWCFTAFRAALRHDHQPSRTFQDQSPALVRQNLGYHA